MEVLALIFFNSLLVLISIGALVKKFGVKIGKYKINHALESFTVNM